MTFSARREQAESVADVLLRRTRLGLLAARDLLEDDSAAVRRVAEALGRERGWDEQRIADEVDRFAVEAAAEGIVVAA